MGRWTDQDEDEARLPEGMQRVGYDADTQRYTFQDADGSYWESAPGSRYGKLTRVPNNPETNTDNARFWSSNPHVTTHQPPTKPSPYYEDDDDNQDDNTNDNAHLLPISTASNPPFAPRRENPWRMLAPFLLLVLLVLLVVFRFMMSGGAPPSSGSGGKHDAAVETCKEKGFEAYTIKKGDTCWSVAKERGYSDEVLRGRTEGVVCDKLRIGDVLCV